MNAKELREKNFEELQAMILDLRNEKWKLKMQQTGQALRTSQFGKLRRDIARVYTVINEMKQDANDE